MNILNLAGTWTFREDGSNEWINGELPGCNFLDLMEAGKIPDPFWGMNEAKVQSIGDKDYEYARDFDVSAELYSHERIELVMSGLDTLTEIRLNGIKIAETENAHRLYRFSVKTQLKEGGNRLTILFKSPVNYITEKHAEYKLLSVSEVKGVSHIRKPQCHFGWDWGPILPLSGISGDIQLEAYNVARIEDVDIKQQHTKNQVALDMHVELDRMEFGNSLSMDCSVSAPDGSVHAAKMAISESKASCTLIIEDPQLWWSNGLGEQPLYTVQMTLYDGDKVMDTWEKQIGLRTIELDTSSDQWGHNFQFIINGVPIFVKGSDWIPSDSFVTRTSAKDLEFYIKSAKDANMNMLRVWGGGYYESDTFYELCDQYGILVWQDFAFACMAYKLFDEVFLENVHLEVLDNVRRLRHHASLALWCGNNEIEPISMLWKKEKKLYQSGIDFFYNVLPEWVAQVDHTTPYWPGSPSGNKGEGGKNSNGSAEGDTHLWQVWHGMFPIESFEKYPTRFCSEFGMESLPSMETVRSFTDETDINIFSPVMLSHQKSAGGNQKMLFYILSKYRNPETLGDFIYLSQLIQSETIRVATEGWRRQMDRCHGSLYWQFNDCWPVASWAGIDYRKQFKAVQYRARHFNQMSCVSAELSRNRADIYVINDYPSAFNGILQWTLSDFQGNIIDCGESPANVDSCSALQIQSLRYKDILQGFVSNEVVLGLHLSEDGQIISKQTCLLVPDKEAKLETPIITKSLIIDGSNAVLTLQSDVFARHVYVNVPGVDTPLSDNFFDLEVGQVFCIQFSVPDGVDQTLLEQKIQIKSLVDVKAKGSRFKDGWIRLAMRLNKRNLLSWLIFKFFV